MSRLDPKTRTAMVFILPSFIGIFIFVLLPVLASFLLSFTEWDLLNPIRVVWLDNYRRLFTSDPLFGRIMYNTVYYVVASVPIGIILSLALAMVLNRAIKGVVFFRTIYFMPVISSTVAVALIWRWFYHPDFGVLNNLLRAVGFSNPPLWLASEKWAMPAMIIMSIWKGLGYNMVLFLAGLQNIPTYLYEAAEIDGIGWSQRLRYITLPLLSPTTFFVLVMALINSFQVFEQALVLTEGGPGIATSTIVLYIYQNAFRYFQMGYASAIAWLLFIIILCLTMIQVHLQNKWVYYQ